MWKWLAMAGCLLSAPSLAADNGVSSPATAPADTPLTATGPFGGGKGPIEAIEDDINEKKSEKELQAEERLAALEAAQSEKAARVVVLKWPETDTDHTNETLIRNIKTRIARPDAKFYPEIDLYQAGRKEPDRSVRPVDQRAMVPDDAIDRVMTKVDEISGVPWNAYNEQKWGLVAHELRELANELWFIDRVDLREPLFMLYSQIGRAADNHGSGSPPFYEQVGERPVNYYWYLAGAMAADEPALMSKLTERDLNASIGNYKDQLDSGSFPPMTLGFELSGSWEPKAFLGEYQLFINGLEVVLTDAKGLHRAAPGRVDVYLARSDGHSLSDRIELDKLSDKIYFVRDVARKKMGIDFIDQLMEHPNECTPEVDGDILNYLAIYAKLHAGAEIYIAVPVGGSIAPNKILLWRWDRPSGTLQKVLDDTGGFPVRFVALVGTGIIFSGVDKDVATTEEVADSAAENQPGTTAPNAKDQGKAAAPTFTPKPAGIPIMYHLRAHYGRLMMAFGIEMTANITKEGGPWVDLYQTNSNKPFKDEFKDADGDVLDPGAYQVSNTVEDCENAAGQSAACNGTNEVVGSHEEVVLRERTWQRLVFYGIGFVLGRNAAIGFGPRGWLRWGWYNTPHAMDLTAHIGWAALAPFTKDHSGRVNPMVDMDLFGGMMLPFRDSLYIPGNTTAFAKNMNVVGEREGKTPPEQKLGKVIPTFGFTLMAGLTF